MKSKHILGILIFTSLLSGVTSAFMFEVPDEVKQRAEKITLGLGEEGQVGNLTIRYDGSSAIYTKFSVKKGDSDWVPFSGNFNGIAWQFLPLWANNVIIYVEKFGAEGSEDLNFVDDNSEVTIWVEDNPKFELTCGDFVDEPKNIGLNTGNFYSSDEDRVRHGFLATHNYPPEVLFNYYFDVNFDVMAFNSLKIFEEGGHEEFENPVQTIPFSGCGDTPFTYNGNNFLIRPYFYMENGNWDITLRKIDRICPKTIPDPELSAIRPSSIKIINLGLYDDVRKPLTNLSAKDVEKFGERSVKVDFKIDERDWNSYIFDDCAWKSVSGGPLIRLSGLYGKEAEFYVVTGGTTGYPPVNEYNPFWDRILEILGRY